MQGNTRMRAPLTKTPTGAEETAMGKLAVDGGTPVRESFLPLCRPFIGEEEKAGVVAALESGWLSTGPRTKGLEEAFCEYLGADHALALNSCTAALHLALVAAGIGPGDEVITSPLTFVSTAHVIVHSGAKPVFADIRADTLNISAGEISARMTGRTRAVIAVHYGGQPCDMEAICSAVGDRGALVVEDAAHAIGASRDGRKVGSAKNTVTAFSFYATKVMTTGEGGMLVTGKEDICERARVLSLHGLTRDAWKRYSAGGSSRYDVVAAGYKYNMGDIQAAMGLAQLKRLDWLIERREAVCARYDRAFGPLEELTIPHIAPGVRHARYIYPILLEASRLKAGRDRVAEALKAEGIGTSVHFAPVHLHSYYREQFGFREGEFPAAEAAGASVLSLPLFAQMEERDVQDVIDAVIKVLGHYRGQEA